MVVMELVVVCAGDVGNIIYGSGGGVDEGDVLLLAEFARVAMVAIVTVVLVVAVFEVMLGVQGVWRVVMGDVCVGGQ